LRVFCFGFGIFFCYKTNFVISKLFDFGLYGNIRYKNIHVVNADYSDNIG